MACPGGCVGGGGQPKSADPLVLLKRMGAGGWVWAVCERARPLGASVDRAPRLGASAAVWPGDMRGGQGRELLGARRLPARPAHLPPAVYSIDERSAIRKSHENPSIQKLYKACAVDGAGLHLGLPWCNCR